MSEMACHRTRARAMAGFAALIVGSVAAPVGAALSVPAYSSLPGAHAQLYLDFGGSTVSNWHQYEPGDIEPYDINGNTSSFSSTELRNIRQIFLRVAEKYSPFNINVTTVDPGNLNNQQTARIIIGGNGSWYGKPAGGVAFLGGFYNGSSNIAWAFPDNLGGGNPKTVAEATAHEAGHLFGLNHQSTWTQKSDGTWIETAEYSTNDNDPYRRPIMGSSYGSQRGLWWNGTTTSATRIQDDLAELSETGGTLTPNFGYRADDHAGSLAGATSLIADAAGAVFNAGVITTTSDLDLFSFVTGTGTIRFATALAEYGGMLDSTLSLFGADGSLLHSAATDNLAEAFTYSATAGQYFVGVSSRGNYGDIGQYLLSGQIVPYTGPLADVAVPEPAMAGFLLAVVYPLVTRRRRARSRV